MKSLWNARRRYLVLLAFRRARQCSELASYGQRAGDVLHLRSTGRAAARAALVALFIEHDLLDLGEIGAGLSALQPARAGLRALQPARSPRSGAGLLGRLGR